MDAYAVDAVRKVKHADWKECASGEGGVESVELVPSAEMDSALLRPAPSSPSIPFHSPMHSDSRHDMVDRIPASRRNGKLASCEPCRKGKIRCDHGRPVCSRCKQRGQVAKCYYHPAPLTKPRAPLAQSSDSSLFNQPWTSSNSPLEQAVPPERGCDHAIEHAIRVENESDRRRTQFESRETTHRRLLQDTIESLRQLRHIEAVSLLISTYASEAQVALVPGPLMKYAASTLSATVRNFSLHEDQESTGNINLLAETVIQSTSAKLNVLPDHDYRTFVEMFTGDNLRLEMLGLIYTIAARAHGKSMPIEVEQDDQLLHALFKAAQSCLYLARELAPSVNDVMIWLSFELTRLYTNAQGDSHPNVWRSLGDLTSDVYILGIHRESKAANGTPFWLAECRRKSWAVIYQWDKFGAKLFDRPPRMLHGYSDCVLPLNLNDHELLGDAVTLQEARNRLTTNGWNPDGLYCSTTWCRMRYMASVIQEKIIAYEYQTITPDSTRELLMLYDQLNAFWESVPDKLRYKPEVWYTKVHAKECLMLAVVWLLHLQSSFRIHRKLMSSDALHARKALEVASLIVNTVKHLSQVRDRSIFLRFDNSYVMLDYGLSAAAMMIEAISNKGPQNWPGSISRSKLVRDLSVFVASLEGICQPGEANHAVCTRAARRIAKALDEVLDSGTSTTGDERSKQVAQTGDTESLMDTTASMHPTAETSGCDVITGGQNGFDGLDFSDLDSWLRSIDWTGVGADYTL